VLRARGGILFGPAIPGGPKMRWLSISEHGFGRVISGSEHAPEHVTTKRGDPAEKHAAKTKS
jgi:hypothetical protein